MKRSPKKYLLKSTNNKESSYNAKQLLKMGSSLIKDFLYRNQQTYLQSKSLRSYQLETTTTTSANVDQDSQVYEKIIEENLEEMNKKNTIKVA